MEALFQNGVCEAKSVFLGPHTSTHSASDLITLSEEWKHRDGEDKARMLIRGSSVFTAGQASGL